MEDRIEIVIAKRNNLITTVFAVAFLTISACSAAAIYVVPIFYVVKSELFDGKHNWIYAVPVAPFLIGVASLYQAARVAKASVDTAEKMAEKLRAVIAAQTDSENDSEK